MNGKLPTSLDGVGVRIAGLDAYIYYISPTQVNGIAPETALTGPLTATLTSGSGKSNPVPANVRSASPALFTFTGGQYAIAQFGDGSLAANPVFPSGRAVHAGDTLGVLRLRLRGDLTGLSTGSILPVGRYNTVAPVTVKVGGKAATVTFAGLISAGLYQINVKLAADTPSGTR